MSILSGFEKIKRYNKKSNGYQLLSHWTSSDTVEMGNGSTLTTAWSAKADLVNGKVPLSEIPKTALDNLVKVADDTARFALTTDQVQNGDTVYVIATDLMYLVVDDTKLNQEAGYQGYSATASWDTLEDRPTNIAYLAGDDEELPDVSPVLRESSLQNNLVTTLPNYPLDARQGKVLDDKITTLNSNLLKCKTLNVSVGCTYSDGGTIGYRSLSSERVKVSDISGYPTGATILAVIPYATGWNVSCITAFDGTYVACSAKNSGTYSINVTVIYI